MKTVGELKEFIKDLPDDMKIVAYQSDLERYGYFNNFSCNVANMKKTLRHTWDRFDYTDYSYNVYVKQKEKSKGTVCCLMIG